VSGALAALVPESPLLDASARAAGAVLDAVAAVAPHVPAVSAGPVPAWAYAVAGALAVATVRARRSALRVAGAAAVGAVLAAAPPPAIAPPPPRAVFLDVGQGDATLVQGRAAAVLVDAGTAVPGGWDAGTHRVLPAVRALGVGRLDLVVASHADLDHRGGLPAVVRALPTARVWLPPGGLRDPAFSRLRAAAWATGATLGERGRGDAPLELGDLRIEPLWPIRGPLAVPTSRNDASLVVRVQAAGGCGVLLAGDVGADAERALAASEAPRVAVLKLAHHGSRTSSSAALLDAVAPRLAVASAPRHSRFGMPHREVRERLEARAIPLAWTGRDGAVLVGLAHEGGLRAWRAARVVAGPCAPATPAGPVAPPGATGTPGPGPSSAPGTPGPARSSAAGNPGPGRPLAAGG
jgi:competence protein ComEC